MVQAVLRGKPVITAMQMLESMTTDRCPTRAETTDVAVAQTGSFSALALLYY